MLRRPTGCVAESLKAPVAVAVAAAAGVVAALAKSPQVAALFSECGPQAAHAGG
jgi:hypothetical protein